MDRAKLAAQIQESPLDHAETDFLLRRLSVASCEGCAAVVRDFEAAMNRYRAKVLPSYRRRLQRALFLAPVNKQAVILDAK